jgi:hypothetical protein
LEKTPTGQVTLGGDGLFAEILVFREGSNCLQFSGECQFYVQTNENGEYTAALRLDNQPSGGALNWCGTEVRATIPSSGSSGTTRNMSRDLSAETAVGGDYSAKRHVVNFAFVM